MTPMMEDHRCHICGQATYITLSTSLRPSFDKRMCRANHTVSWIPVPITLDAADAYVIPWGEFKCMSFADVDRIGDGRGRRYIEWLAECARSEATRQLALTWLIGHPMEDAKPMEAMP